MKKQSKLGINEYIFSENELQIIEDALEDAIIDIYKERLEWFESNKESERYKSWYTYYHKADNLLKEIRKIK